MQANIEMLKPEIMQQIADPNNLIGDVAEDYGIPRRLIYQWIKSEQKLDKRTKAIKEQRLKTKLQQLSTELAHIQSL
jgi:transposase-like protein